MDSSKGQLCDLAKSLNTDLVRIGTIPEQQEILGKPFPLVLEPVSAGTNFVQLQEPLSCHCHVKPCFCISRSASSLVWTWNMLFQLRP